jgi:hypothetical protein
MDAGGGAGGVGVPAYVEYISGVDTQAVRTRHLCRVSLEPTPHLRVCALWFPPGKSEAYRQAEVLTERLSAS